LLKSVTRILSSPCGYCRCESFAESFHRFLDICPDGVVQCLLLADILQYLRLAGLHKLQQFALKSPHIVDRMASISPLVAT